MPGRKGIHGQTVESKKEKQRIKGRLKEGEKPKGKKALIKYLREKDVDKELGNMIIGTYERAVKTREDEKKFYKAVEHIIAEHIISNKNLEEDVKKGALWILRNVELENVSENLMDHILDISESIVYSEYKVPTAISVVYLLDKKLPKEEKEAMEWIMIKMLKSTSYRLYPTLELISELIDSSVDINVLKTIYEHGKKDNIKHMLESLYLLVKSEGFKPSWVNKYWKPIIIGIGRNNIFTESTEEAIRTIVNHVVRGYLLEEYEHELLLDLVLNVIRKTYEDDMKTALKHLGESLNILLELKENEKLNPYREGLTETLIYVIKKGKVGKTADRLEEFHSILKKLENETTRDTLITLYTSCPD